MTIDLCEFQILSAAFGLPLEFTIGEVARAAGVSAEVARRTCQRYEHFFTVVREETSELHGMKRRKLSLSGRNREKLAEQLSRVRSQLEPPASPRGRKGEPLGLTAAERLVYDLLPNSEGIERRRLLREARAYLEVAEQDSDVADDPTSPEPSPLKHAIEVRLQVLRRSLDAAQNLSDQSASGSPFEDAVTIAEPRGTAASSHLPDETARRSSAAPNLNGLAEFALRSGIDLRPMLAYGLTSHYVQIPAHMPQDEQYYTELMLRLIDSIDPSTRAIVANMLADYSAAPPKVVENLARYPSQAAEPPPGRSLPLSSPDRSRSDDERMPAVTTAGSLGALERPVAEPRRRIVDLFFGASSTERRAILADLARIAPRQDVTPTARAEVISRLEAAAVERGPEVFVKELQSTLDISEELAQRIVFDGSGEPLLVALRTLSVDPAIVAKILIFLNQKINQAVERLSYLMNVYNTISSDAAVLLMSWLREIGPGHRRSHGQLSVRWSESIIPERTRHEVTAIVRGAVRRA
jgi:hypothetical protein